MTGKEKKPLVINKKKPGKNRSGNNPDSLANPLVHPRIERPLMHNNVIIRRIVNVGRVSSSSAAPVLGALTFALSSVPGYTEFTVAYDQYRIKKVAIMLRPTITQASLGGVASPTTELGFIASAVDLDDGTAPVSLSELYEYSACDLHMFYERFTVEFQPRVAQGVYGSAVFTNYAMAPKDLWLDCASASTEHYGFKYGIPAIGVAGNVWSTQIFVAYEIEFRFVR